MFMDFICKIQINLYSSKLGCKLLVNLHFQAVIFQSLKHVFESDK